MDRSRIYFMSGDKILEKNVTINNYLFWDSLPIQRKNIQSFRKIPEIKFKMGGESGDFDFNIQKTNSPPVDICMSKAQLSESAKGKLLDLVKNAGKMKMGKFHHHETGGGLVGRKADGVWQIDVVPTSYIKGEGDGTNVPKGGKLALGYANFHTHPKGEYKKQKVKYAWPSGDDYLSIMEKMYKENTILHIVATMEGIYAISLSPKLADISKKNLESLYNSKSPLKYKRELPDIGSSKSTPSTYLKEIKNIKNPIYTVEFRSWRNKTPFNFYFPPDKHGSCGN